MIEMVDFSIQQGSFSLSNVHLRIGENEHVCLLGKTGCGKSTILEAICGLRPNHQGKILLGGVDHSHSSPSQRNIGFVPQDGALFPTMTVRQQMSLALKIRKQEPSSITERVEALAGSLGIEHLLDQRPLGFSGGETQRVALGRALSFQPSLLCLDEPFSALDDGTREEMFQLVEGIRNDHPVSILHISHNLEEVERLADRVYHLVGGELKAYAADDFQLLKQQILQPQRPDSP